MPQRNVIKIYVNNGIYHVYNRGVEKRVIFKDKKDYRVFLSYLKEYLSPQQGFSLSTQGETLSSLKRPHKNYYNEIELFVYCLMPNHFHLLVRQIENDSMEKFMRSLATRYSMYFNKRYKRVGSLFQGPYKAVFITNDSYLLHLSRYIHLNPSEHTDNLTTAYSSYADYLGSRNTPWVKTEFVLKFFNKSNNLLIDKPNNYKDFVENYKRDSSTILGKLTLE